MAWNIDSQPTIPRSGFFGDTARLKVDVAQTGFFEGREFRLDLEITGPYVVRFTSPINFELQSQTLLSHDGTATFTVYEASQGTPGGTFDEDVGVLPNNGMTDTPAYTPVISVLGGGSFTPNPDPNKPKEKIKAVSATATAQRSTVGGEGPPERGLPPGTYYLLFTGTDAEYHLVYEERP